MIVLTVLNAMAVSLVLWYEQEVVPLELELLTKFLVMEMIQSRESVQRGIILNHVSTVSLFI